MTGTSTHSAKGSPNSPSVVQGMDLSAGAWPTLLIQPSDRLIEQGAIHLDLRPEEQSTCVEHALELGATYADIGQAGDEVKRSSVGSSLVGGVLSVNRPGFDAAIFCEKDSDYAQAVPARSP